MAFLESIPALREAKLDTKVSACFRSPCCLGSVVLLEEQSPGSSAKQLPGAARRH